MSDSPVEWTDLPASLAEHFADPAVTLPALVAAGMAEVVKHNPHRTIYRVHVCGQDLHVKQCRVRGWRAWLREWLRPPKASLEYGKLLAAARRKVPAVRPLACGVAASTLPGASYLVSPTVDGAAPLTRLLEDLPPDSRFRIALAQALGRFIARVHHGGVRHSDLHPGNILVRRHGGPPEMYLLDLHDARIGAPVAAAAAVANLVLFNRWFILRTHRTDRLRFWRAYVIERSRLSGRCVVDYFAAKDLERRTEVSNQRLWQARSGRCLGANRRFRRIAAAGVAGFAVADWTDAEIAPLLCDPDALFRGATVLKDSRSSTVAVRDLSMNGVTRRVVCKLVRATSWSDPLASLVRPTASRRSWVNGHALLDALLPTPRPLAMLHRYVRGLAGDAYLITEHVPDAVDLRAAVRDAAGKRNRIDTVARLVRDLHARGFAHRDLKAANVLLARGDAPWLIDLAGVRRAGRVTSRRRVRDLARLNASFHDLPELSKTDRLRFLRIYLNFNLHGRGDWKAWWRRVESATRGKMAKNQRRGRPLA